MPCLAISTGSPWPSSKTGISSCLPTTFNWSIAAGRYTSHATSSGRRCCCLRSRPASLAQLVVLPAPCKPAIMTMVGGLGAMVKRVVWPPSRATSSSLTILMTCWVGDRLSRISASVAFSVTVLMKSLATLKLTSASSSAMRISRMASLISDSVSRPLLRRCLKADEIFSVRPSNAMLSLLPELVEQRRHAGGDRLRFAAVQCVGV